MLSSQKNDVDVWCFAVLGSTGTTTGFGGAASGGTSGFGSGKSLFGQTSTTGGFGGMYNYYGM